MLLDCSHRDVVVPFSMLAPTPLVLAPAGFAAMMYPRFIYRPIDDYLLVLTPALPEIIEKKMDEDEEKKEV